MWTFLGILIIFVALIMLGIKWLIPLRTESKIVETRYGGHEKFSAHSKMKRKMFLIISLIALMLINYNCTSKKTDSDYELQKKTETIMQEATREIGMPAIINFQEKRNLKWIYELCDQENLICYAYLYNAMNGSIGDYLGECIGYGIPYSTQYSNPNKYIDDPNGTIDAGSIVIPQAEPNGLFKPTGLSATWLIMIDPETKKPRPVYIEPEIIVSPFKLK